MADVFISHKNEDREAAEFVASQLSKVQISSWWDASLVAGETFSDAIRTELRSARAVVVLWSKASWTSRWVQAEAQAGLDKGALVAARLDDVALEPPFNVIQTADLRDASGVASLIAGVERALGGDGRGGYNGSAVRFRGGRSKWLIMVLGAAVVIGFVAAASFTMWGASNRDAPAQVVDVDAPRLDGGMKRGASFEVRFIRGSFWLNAAADEIARRFAVQSDDPPDRVVIQSTCRLQTDQKLEDDRATAVFVAIRRGGIPAEAIEAHPCDLMVAPSVPPGAVRVSVLWSSEAPSEAVHFPWLAQNLSDPVVAVDVAEDFIRCAALQNMMANDIRAESVSTAETIEGVALGAQLVARLFIAEFKSEPAEIEPYYVSRYQAHETRLRGLRELEGGALSALEEDMARCVALNPIQSDFLAVIRSQPATAE